MMIGLLWQSTSLVFLGLNLLIFSMSFNGIEQNTALLQKINFTLFMVRCFFLLISFLVAEDYELPKCVSHNLSVPLNLERIRILARSISFFSYFNCLPNDFPF